MVSSQRCTPAKRLENIRNDDVRLLLRSTVLVGFTPDFVGIWDQMHNFPSLPADINPSGQAKTACAGPLQILD
jgi:hypothetical protein